MAKFEEMKSGRKFYQLRGDYSLRDRRTKKRVQNLYTMYVIGTNEETQTVLASINKMPPVWFSRMNYRSWQKENPLETIKK